MQGVRAGGGDDRVGQVLDSGEVHGAARPGGGQARVRYPLLPALPRQAGHLLCTIRVGLGLGLGFGIGLGLGLGLGLVGLGLG